MIRRPPRSTLLTHSFPTRRSSDLEAGIRTAGAVHGRSRCRASPGITGSAGADARVRPAPAPGTGIRRVPAAQGRDGADLDACGPRPIQRSEEHTSELQSLMRISYAVFCLKKKKKKKRHKDTYLYKRNTDSRNRK